MPELPEVEHVARSLNILLSGRTILNAKLIRQKLAPDILSAAFARVLKNASINFVHRRGKHILFDLNNGRTLITHLRMTGTFMILPAEREDPKFTHAVFHLDGDKRLVFQDQRHFGLMKVVKTANLYETEELQKLAPEPFSDEFSANYVREVTQSSKRPIKELIVDQTKFCGLGNIYAAEALYLARISPKTPSDRISAGKAKALFEAVRVVLSEAINFSVSFEIDPENIERTYFSGGNRDGWYVYDRENLPCKSCNSPIKRIKQGGRSSFYCGRCQRTA